MTPPPSLPPTGEGLPEEIVKAINLHRQAAKTTARRPMTGNAEAEGIAYRALTATILHHLSAARARAERAEAALTPFAEADHPTQAWDGQRGLRDLEPDEMVNIRVELGEIDAARAALSQGEER